MNNYSKLSEKDYNLEVIKKLESKNNISQTKANLFRVFTVLWKNPIINWKLISKWNQKWLISIAHKVEWSQYSILWWQAKNVFKDQEQLGIFWKLIAKNIWWNQMQSTVFWWIQKAENIWASQIQLTWLNFWYQQANKVNQDQVQFWIFWNIWKQIANINWFDQYQLWLVFNIWHQENRNKISGAQIQKWNIINLYYQYHKSWIEWIQEWLIRLWKIINKTKKTSHNS